MNFLRHILLCGCSAVLCACGNPGSAVSDAPGNPASVPSAIVLIDVRSADEYASGHLRGAVNIPHDRITEEIGSVAADKSTPVILYCRSGRRAETALNALKAAGYENVSNCGGLEDARLRLDLPVTQ